MTTLVKEYPYSKWRECKNGLVFFSGVVGVDKDGALAGDVRSQVRQALENLRMNLALAGLDVQDVVKVTAFLAVQDDFEAFNEVYATAFQDPRPARSTVVGAPPVKGMLVEIEAIAERLKK